MSDYSDYEYDYYDHRTDSDATGDNWQDDLCNDFDDVTIGEYLGDDLVGSNFKIGIMDDMPLTHGASYWDKLPNEIKDMVFSYASPLTLFFTGRLRHVSKRDQKAILSLWMEAFDTDWPGDLRSLPELSYPKLENCDLTRVKSRSMYERLCKHFPDVTEGNAKFAKLDESIESLDMSSKQPYHRSSNCLPDSPFRLLHIPMRHMWLDILGDTLDKFPYARTKDCILEGHTDLLRHLVDTGRVESDRIDQALREYSRFSFHRAVDAAAERGHLDILKLLHEVGCPKASTKAMNMAAEHGYLDIVKWLHENRTEGCTTDSMDEAVKNGHFEIVKFLHENRTEGCTTRAMDWAAKNGFLEIVKFLHENRTEGCSDKAMHDAIEKGQIEIVKFLYQNRTEHRLTSAINWAARRGRLEIVKFLHKNPTETCTTDAMDYAAKNGHFEVVEWLHQNRTEGCTIKAMDLAVKNGFLDIVKFLHMHRTEGCSSRAIYNAVINDHPKVVRFLLDNRSEGFNQFSVKMCKSAEIAEMLVSSMPLKRRRKMMKMALSERWYGTGFEILKKSVGS